MLDKSQPRRAIPAKFRMVILGEDTPNDVSVGIEDIDAPLLLESRVALGRGSSKWSIDHCYR
jgi:hypothetical protein